MWVQLTKESGLIQTVFEGRIFEAFEVVGDGANNGEYSVKLDHSDDSDGGILGVDECRIIERDEILVQITNERRSTWYAFNRMGAVFPVVANNHTLTYSVIPLKLGLKIHFSDVIVLPDEPILPVESHLTKYQFMTRNG